MRIRLLSALLALPLGWGAYASFLPPAAPVAVAALGQPHSLPMEGSSNFRDVGGYLTEYGQRVRLGLVYRGASTDTLTRQDLERIHALGIRMFCDLRDAPERRPVRPAGADAPLIQTWPDVQHYGQINVGSPAAANKMMMDGYARMPQFYAGQIGDIFRHIARGELPILYNCSAGKDRTGVTTAILLRLLGVPMKTVERDYLASSQLFRAQATAREHPLFAVHDRRLLDPKVVAVLGAVKREWLRAAFASIDARYGSLDHYLHNGLRLNDGEIASIRRRMLEPGSDTR